MSTHRQPQSVAALLPEEILDSIFAQFGFNYSMDASARDRMERFSILSHMSVVAEGWTRPARRLLFRTVMIQGWSHLQREVEEGMGVYVRELEIRGYALSGTMSPQEVASAVFKLLKQVPNLRRLRLCCPSFDRFDQIEPASMHAAVLLPHLHDLYISHTSFPHSLEFDLLTTSDHQISRLSVHSASAPVAPHPVCKQIDFRGKLRFLSTGMAFYRSLVDPRLVASEGLRGLEELHLRGIDRRSREGGAEMYRVIAPTLSVLLINCDDVEWFAHFLPLFSNLSRLSLSPSHPHGEHDPTPLLLCLPPSLSVLRLRNDMQIGPSLARWTATPSLVPEGLKQIHIDNIYEFETYQQLPPVPTLGTSYHTHTITHLQRLTPGTLTFKTLEMWFHDQDLGQRTVVQAECSRLGVVFRQRVDTGIIESTSYVLAYSLKLRRLILVIRFKPRSNRSCRLRRSQHSPIDMRGIRRSSGDSRGSGVDGEGDSFRFEGDVGSLRLYSAMQYYV